MTAPRVRFDRNELAGAFGDIGTDLPLIIGVVLASGMDVAGVFIVFGCLQVLTGLCYGIPMPVQPLKAIAALVIAQSISAPLVFGAGLAIGLTMLLLTITGLLDFLAKAIPKAVVRGIQFGLGLQLSLLALQKYVPAQKEAGYVLAGIGFIIIILFLGNRTYPPALFVIALGILYAVCCSKIAPEAAVPGSTVALPRFHLPTLEDIGQGFLLLALPQIPLSLANSILATSQIVRDFFPAKEISVRKIGLTYAGMNLVAPFLSGLPVCHGSGGIAGHYAFGARTGGSVVIYGLLYLSLGVFFSKGLHGLIAAFPLPLLGVILLFEGVALMSLLADLGDTKPHLNVAVVVGVMAVGLPYGYAVATVVGVILMWLVSRRETPWF